MAMAHGVEGRFRSTTAWSIAAHPDRAETKA
jgi:hypothetical protein